MGGVFFRVGGGGACGWLVFVFLTAFSPPSLFCVNTDLQTEGSSLPSTTITITTTRTKQGNRTKPLEVELQENAEERITECILRSERHFGKSYPGPMFYTRGRGGKSVLDGGWGGGGVQRS